MQNLLLDVTGELPEKFVVVSKLLKEKDGNVLSTLSQVEADAITGLVKNDPILSKFILMLVIDITSDQIHYLPENKEMEDDYIKQSIKNLGALDILNTLYNLDKIKAEYDNS